MKCHKGQITAELLIFFTMGLVFLGAMLVIMASQTKINLEDAEQRELEQIADQVYQEVLIAASMEDGYERSFEVPSTVATKSYILEILNESVVNVRTDEKIASRQIFKVQGTPTIPTITLQKANDTVTIS